LSSHDVWLSLAALALVLGLVWVSSRLARRLGFARLAPMANGPAKQRLRLVQSLALDPRRRILLIECDGRGHLVLIGGGTDLSLGWVAAEPPHSEIG